LKGKNREKKVKALVDSGASTLFISKRFVEQNSVSTRKLLRPIPVRNIDGSLNSEGSMTEYAVLTLIIGDHEEKEAAF
ncbi:hypothetical protein K503DRAFT_659735, partial [Rhizopogon vinicolor AM-OR11-026]